MNDQADLPGRLAAAAPGTALLLATVIAAGFFDGLLRAGAG
jgi:hypothetical protein